jgi:hypothetical protein
MREITPTNNKDNNSKIKTHKKYCSAIKKILALKMGRCLLTIITTIYYLNPEKVSFFPSLRRKNKVFEECTGSKLSF